jgi:hypothetical protein
MFHRKERRFHSLIIIPGDYVLVHSPPDHSAPTSKPINIPSHHPTHILGKPQKESSIGGLDTPSLSQIQAIHPVSKDTTQQTDSNNLGNQGSAPTAAAKPGSPGSWPGIL